MIRPQFRDALHASIINHYDKSYCRPRTPQLTEVMISTKGKGRHGKKIVKGYDEFSADIFLRYLEQMYRNFPVMVLFIDMARQC